MRIRLALATAATMVPTAAFAHPGDLAEFGFVAGLMHPLTGADHLAAALLVGGLAALSRRTGSVLAGFVSAVAAGLLAGGAFPEGVAWAAELGIAVGFAAIASAFLLHKSRTGLLPFGATVATGAAHGLVHASQGAGATAFAAGVLVATAALALAGCLIAGGTVGWRRTGALPRN